MKQHSLAYIGSFVISALLGGIICGISILLIDFSGDGHQLGDALLGSVKSGPIIGVMLYAWVIFIYLLVVRWLMKILRLWSLFDTKAYFYAFCIALSIATTAMILMRDKFAPYEIVLVFVAALLVNVMTFGTQLYFEERIEGGTVSDT